MLVWKLFGLAVLYGAAPDIWRGYVWVGRLLTRGIFWGCRSVRSLNRVIPLMPMARIGFCLTIIIFFPSILAILLDDPVISAQVSLNPITNMANMIPTLLHSRP